MAPACIVKGGTSGIGLETAKALSAAGAAVTLQRGSQQQPAL
jgi:NAD(P)-dependent dehydrogenase (short-subunit alcohol dehydrogenase family)